MSLRKLTSKHPALWIGIAVAVVALAIWRPWQGNTGGPVRVTNKWFYDLESGDLVKVGPDIGKPPAVLPSGHTGVEAHVFACGDCAGQTFIGYLERWSDDAKKYFANPSDKPLDMMTARLVAAPPEKGRQPQWILGQGPEGMALIPQPDRCPGSILVTCYP